MSEPHRILVVDDAPAVRESLGWLLADQPGMTVVGEAATGTDAIKQTRALNPELVILDIELPDINGFEVTRQIKSLPNPPFVLLLSIHGDALSRQRGQNAGCDAFVDKSLGWPNLLKILKQALV